MHDSTTPRVVTPQDLIGTASAASILGIDRATLTRWVATGRISPLGRIDGSGPFVFDRSDIEAVK
ncbi:helix-turn-helix domain-containing protein [Arthrobacter woluwensis]|uniref:helix-turn-helix domain-containing protein n=1 Tax=Arthrobacter woluwensis TaxID=156980 RepID=UPI00119F417B